MQIFRLLKAAVFSACSLIFFLPAFAQSAAPYKGFIAIDAASGKVLAEENADFISPPASMTKLMTYAVLHDKLVSGVLSLDTQVTVSADDARMGGTQVYLKQGEVFSVRELVYAMMIQSANDAAHALARAAGGSVPAFVAMMNDKSRELGMTRSTFRTPHGLPPSNRQVQDGDLTTPRDYALLSRYLVTKTDAIDYTRVRMRKFGEGIRSPDTVIDMVNHNKLIERVAGVDGLKTGFTRAAGFCLAATAERNGRRVIAVVMGSPDGKTRDLKVVDLIERGFASLPATANPVSVPRPAPPAQPEVIPTVKTDRSAPVQQSSTEPEPMFKLNLPPSEKVKSLIRRLSLPLLALLALCAVPLHAQRERIPMEDLEIVEKRWPNTKRTYTSMRYIIEKPGDVNGPTPEKGMMVEVLYKGMLLDGTVFDQSKDENSPLKIRLGRGGLIEGWEEALQRMHKGEKWTLIIPPELAYGARGKPPSIPRRATLVFEMELINFYEP